MYYQPTLFPKLQAIHAYSTTFTALTCDKKYVRKCPRGVITDLKHYNLRPHRKHNKFR